MIHLIFSWWNRRFWVPEHGAGEIRESEQGSGVVQERRARHTGAVFSGDVLRWVSRRALGERSAGIHLPLLQHLLCAQRGRENDRQEGWSPLDLFTWNWLPVVDRWPRVSGGGEDSGRQGAGVLQMGRWPLSAVAGSSGEDQCGRQRGCFFSMWYILSSKSDSNGGVMLNRDGRGKKRTTAWTRRRSLSSTRGRSSGLYFPDSWFLIRWRPSSPIECPPAQALSLLNINMLSKFFAGRYVKLCIRGCSWNALSLPPFFVSRGTRNLSSVDADVWLYKYFLFFLNV